MIGVAVGPPRFACLLRPGGIFVLDVRVPDLATLAEAQRVRPRAFVDLDVDAIRRTAEERGTVAAVHLHDLRAASAARQRAPGLRPVDQRALAERLVTDFASHIYFPAELELLFLSAGFEIAQQYVDYRFVRFDRTSPYVVTVARRLRRSGRRPYSHNRHSTLRLEHRKWPAAPSRSA
jgi:hypothetical protein